MRRLIFSPLVGGGVLGVTALSEGNVTSSDARYLLRPEAAESMFVLHRITGQDKYRQGSVACTFTRLERPNRTDVFLYNVDTWFLAFFLQPGTVVRER